MPFLFIEQPKTIIFIVFVLVLFFGAKRIPELARGLGKGIREFKDASSDIRTEQPFAHPQHPQQPGYPQEGYPQQPAYTQAGQPGYPQQPPYGQPQYGQQPYPQAPVQQVPTQVPPVAPNPANTNAPVS